MTDVPPPPQARVQGGGGAGTAAVALAVLVAVGVTALFLTQLGATQADPTVPPSHYGAHDKHQTTQAPHRSRARRPPYQPLPDPPTARISSSATPKNPGIESSRTSLPWTIRSRAGP